MNKIIVNCETGKTIQIPLNADEIAELDAKEKATKAEVKAELAEAEAKSAARQAILDRLGLTADEAKLLLG